MTCLHPTTYFELQGSTAPLTKKTCILLLYDPVVSYNKLVLGTKHVLFVCGRDTFGVSSFVSNDNKYFDLLCTSTDFIVDWTTNTYYCFSNIRMAIAKYIPGWVAHSLTL